MLILTKEQYDKINNSTMGYVVLTGDEWGDDMGTSERVVKIDDKLIPIKVGYYDFNENNDEGYEFDVIFKRPE